MKTGEQDERRYRSFFDNTYDAVFVCIMDERYQFDRFTEVNVPACRILGHTRDELLGMSFFDITDPADAVALKRAAGRLCDLREVIFEVIYITRDKRRIPVEISGRLFDHLGVPVVVSVARDVTRRKRYEEELKTSSRQLRNLASRIQSIREEERSVLAREIHDELGQALTALKIQVSLLANKLNEDQTGLRNRALSVQEMIDQTMDSLQRILAKLRPGILDELGLVAAIEWQAQDFQRLTGITCDCLLPDENPYLDDEKSTAVFRIFQEALTNIARHANADHVSITMRIGQNRMTLEVTDNGDGISSSQVQDWRSLGILGMKERTLILGGRFWITGVRGAGTNVKLELPLGEKPEDPEVPDVNLIEH